MSNRKKTYYPSDEKIWELYGKCSTLERQIQQARVDSIHAMVNLYASIFTYIGDDLYETPIREDKVAEIFFMLRDIQSIIEKVLKGLGYPPYPQGIVSKNGGDEDEEVE